MQTGAIAPSPPLSPSFIHTCRRFSFWASVVVLIAGLMVLLGWALDIDVLKSIIPGRVTQKPNTALGLMLGSGALLLWHGQAHRQPGERHRWQRMALVVLPVLVLLLGWLTLAEYGLGLDLGINQLVFVEPSPDAVDAIAGGRPAPNTALNFLLLGGALLLLEKRQYRAAQGLSLGALFIALLALTGHLYTVTEIYRVGSPTGMAIHTAGSFLLLALGTLAATADRGWMQDLSSSQDGGIMMRRLLPLILVVPLLIGFAMLLSYDTLIRYPERAVALRSIFTTSLFSAVIWLNGRSLNRLDAQRQALQNQFTEELENQVAIRTAELQVANTALKTENLNRQQAEANLRESEARTRRAITFAPFPIVIHAEDGEILAISQTLTDITGYTAADIPTIADWTERAYGKRQAEVRTLINNLYQVNNRVHDGEFAVRTKTGETRHWDFSSAPLGYAVDGRRLVISMASDITRRKQMDAALEESEQRFRALFATIEDGFCLVELLYDQAGRPYDHRFIEVNPAFKQQTGLDQVTGKTILEVAPNLAPETHWFELYDQVLRTGESARFESGSAALGRWFEGHAFKMPGTDAPQVAVLFREVSDRKRAEAALAERAAQQAEIAFIGQQALASSNLNEFFNTVVQRVAQVLRVDFCKLLELLPGQQGLLLRAGTGWHDVSIGQTIVPAGENSQAGYTLQAKAPTIVEDLRTDPRFNGPALLTQHSVISGISTVIGDIENHPFGVIGVHSRTRRQFTENDVNFLQAIANILAESVAQHRSEQKIQQINASLEQRIAERTQQLVEVNQELEAFAYSVSHDLRAPLRAVEGLARIFQEDYDHCLDATGREYTRLMIDSASQMDQLIQDLLAYSRLGRRDIMLAPVSLQAVVAETLQNLAPTFAEITHQEPNIQVDALPEVIAQRSILRQVLTNLLTNAIKFVEAETPPAIHIWAEDQDDRVRLWIADNGIGIDERHHPRVFQPFERLHGIETYPGTGIGLAIVQRGIERMGGRVGLESQPGVGSRFWFELPRA